jgi:hypothetical protein
MESIAFVSGQIVDDVDVEVDESCSPTKMVRKRHRKVERFATLRSQFSDPCIERRMSVEGVYPCTTKMERFR